MPLLWISFAFIAGIALGDFLAFPLLPWLGGACAGLALLVFPRLRRPPPFSPLPLPILLAAFCLGGVRWALAQPEITPAHPAGWVGREIVLEGVIVAPADVREAYTGLRVRAEKLHPAGDLRFLEVHGELLARVSPGAEWHYGDRVRLEGRIETPPVGGDFDYAAYLRRQGIYAYLPDAQALRLGSGEGSFLLRLLDGLRSRGLTAIYRMLPDPEASLLAGILLGVERGIPQDVQRAFQATGTAHVIAISGFNFAVIAAALTGLAGRLFGKRRGALAAGIGITIYALLVGAGAAVVRAALMSGLSLIAGLLGRRQHGLNSLAFIAALMALQGPNVLWDVGFQLSFAATLGLLLYAEPLQEGFVRLLMKLSGGRIDEAHARRLSGPAGEYILLTLAAQLTTLPVLVYHFQRLSLSAVFANPLILPAQPLVLMIGGPAVLLGLLFPPAGQLLAYLTWPFLAYTIRAVEAFARLPWGDISLGSISLAAVILSYAILLGWKRLSERLRTGLPCLQPALRPAAGLLGLSLLSGLVWQCVLCAPDGRLHLTLLDVGAGEALLVQAPEGQRLLLNSGASASRLSNALGRCLPLNERRLEMLVVGSIEEEDLAAAPAILERFPPGRVLWSGAPLGTDPARLLQLRSGEQGIPIIQAETGQALDLGRGASLQILSVTRRGAVLLLEWENFRALLPLGPDLETLEMLPLEPVSILLLAEGGYAPANPPEWVRALQPQVVLLSVTAGDRRGRPDPETLSAVEGYTLLRTDRNGWIHLSTDGKQMWVEVERR